VSVPSWWRFPIIGSFGGDGGDDDTGEVSLVVAELELLFHLDKSLITVRKTKKVMKVIIGRKNKDEGFSCREVDIDFQLYVVQRLRMCVMSFSLICCISINAESGIYKPWKFEVTNVSVCGEHVQVSCYYYSRANCVIYLFNS